MVWNDVHLPEPGYAGPVYPGAEARANWAVECANGRHGFDPVDFVVGIGDIIHGQHPDFTPEYAHLRKVVLDRLRVPYLPCLGNHETHEGHDPKGYAAYDAQFGPGKREYVFTCGGIGFVVIDACYAGEPPAPAWTRCNAFLRRSLNALAEQGLPAVLVSHVPLVPVRDEDVYAESFGFGKYYAVMDPQVLAAVREHAAQVIAVLSGHIHLTGMVIRDGIHHLVVSGTASYPSDLATFDVYDDRIDVQVHRAPEELQDHGADIHGRPRYDIDYTDASHPDHESYVSGNPGERSFSIPLAGARRPAKATDSGLHVLPGDA